MWSLEARNGYTAAPSALAIILLVGLTAGGCASTSSSGEQAETPSVWDRTVQGVSSALETTKTAVTTTVRRIVREQREGWMEMQEKEKREQEAAAARKEALIVRTPQAAPADKFPAERVVSREQNLGRQVPPQGRGPESRDLVLLPRIPQTPAQIRSRMAEIDRVLPGERDLAQRQRLTAERTRLASALQASIEEESLIREMEELRGRLRRLQNRLDEIQRARP